MSTLGVCYHNYVVVEERDDHVSSKVNSDAEEHVRHGLNANFTTDRDRKLASPPALRHNRSTDQDTGLWSRCACLDWPGLL